MPVPLAMLEYEDQEDEELAGTTVTVVDTFAETELDETALLETPHCGLY